MRVGSEITIGRTSHLSDWAAVTGNVAASEHFHTDTIRAAVPLELLSAMTRVGVPETERVELVERLRTQLNLLSEQWQTMTATAKATEYVVDDVMTAMRRARLARNGRVQVDGYEITGRS